MSAVASGRYINILKSKVRKKRVKFFIGYQNFGAICS